MMSIQIIRQDIVTYARRMHIDGLVVGTAGNVSVRIPGQESVAITPSSIPYDQMQPDDVPIIDFNGTVVVTARAPSTEWGLHLGIYHARPDVEAIFHTHSVHSSILAVLRAPLPPIVEELVHYVGGQVEVAAYAPTQSPELSRNVVVALGDRAAALIANHGNVGCGKDLATAYNVCHLVERVAQVYILARMLGTPVPLPANVIVGERLLFERV